MKAAFDDVDWHTTNTFPFSASPKFRRSFRHSLPSACYDRSIQEESIEKIGASLGGWTSQPRTLSRKLLRIYRISSIGETLVCESNFFLKNNT